MPRSGALPFQVARGKAARYACMQCNRPTRAEHRRPHCASDGGWKQRSLGTPGTLWRTVREYSRYSLWGAPCERWWLATEMSRIDGKRMLRLAWGCPVNSTCQV